jgi:molybdopterin molybdotransferase
MTPLESALPILLDMISPLEELESLPLVQAFSRVLAQDIVASVSVPPADNSAMDGYALRFDDLDGTEGQRFLVSERLAAGDCGSGVLSPGTAARIFTGAEIPSGADIVVMQEQVAAEGEWAVIKAAQLKKGDNIRLRGQDIEAGSCILRAGQRLSAQHMGLLASVGIDRVPVIKRLRIAIISTGSELVEPGEALSQGQIYNSNRYTLIGLLNAMGCEVVDLGIVPDDLELTCEYLKKAAASADCILSSGGVSVGEEDYVQAALARLGQVDFWKLAIKPGKPLLAGQVEGVPFIGLPGNPVAVFVTFKFVVAAVLKRLSGECDDQRAAAPCVLAQADFDWSKPGRRKEFLRGRLCLDGTGTQEHPVVSLYANQSSGVLSSVCWANCLVEMAIGETVERGGLVKIHLI